MINTSCVFCRLDITTKWRKRHEVRQTVAGACFDSGEESRVSWVSVKGVTALNNTAEFDLSRIPEVHPTLHPPECFMIPSSRLSVICQYMPTHFHPLDSLLLLCLAHSFLCVSVSLVFDGSAQKSAEVPALSTGRRTTSSVISPCCRGTQPRDH